MKEAGRASVGGGAVSQPATKGDRTAKSDRFQHPAKVHVIGLPTDEKERMKLVCSTAGSDGESVTAACERPPRKATF